MTTGLGGAHLNKCFGQRACCGSSTRAMLCHPLGQVKRWLALSFPPPPGNLDVQGHILLRRWLGRRRRRRRWQAIIATSPIFVWIQHSGCQVNTDWASELLGSCLANQCNTEVFPVARFNVPRHILQKHCLWQLSRSLSNKIVPFDQGQGMRLVCQVIHQEVRQGQHGQQQQHHRGQQQQEIP